MTPRVVTWEHFSGLLPISFARPKLQHGILFSQTPFLNNFRLSISQTYNRARIKHQMADSKNEICRLFAHKQSMGSASDLKYRCIYIKGAFTIQRIEVKNQPGSDRLLVEATLPIPWRFMKHSGVLLPECFINAITEFIQ